MKEVEKDGYVFRKSTRKDKKYDVFKDGKRIASFGSRLHEHYNDRIGLWSHKNHNDKNRKRLYYARHGRQAEKETPKWFSHKYLWGGSKV